MSFMAVIEDEAIRAINEQTRLATLSSSRTRTTFFTVLSGTMDQWHDAIVTGCRVETEWEFRSVMNGIHTLLINAGFREAFPYMKIEQQDGTFTLNASH